MRRPASSEGPGPGSPHKRQRRNRPPAGNLPSESVDLTAQASPLISPPHGISPIPAHITISKETKNINKWLVALPTLSLSNKETQPANQPPEPEQVSDLQNAPVLDSRAFEVVEVKQVDSWRKTAAGSRQDVLVRTIKVQDKSQQNAPIFEVYNLSQQPMRTNVMPWRTGHLDEAICPTDRDALELGEQVCALMNRLPFQLDAKRWNNLPTNAKVALERRIVEARALDLWLAPFDRSQLYGGVLQDLNLGVTPQKGTKREELSRIDHPTIFKYSIRCLLSSGSNGNPLKSHVTVTIDCSRLDPAKLDALAPAPDDFAYLLRQLPEGTKILPEYQEILLEVFRRIQAAVTFKCGSKTQISDVVEAMLYEVYRSGGPMLQLVKKKLPGLPWKSPIFHVIANWSAVRVRPALPTERDVEGTLPVIFCTGPEHALIAYPINKMLARLDQGVANVIELWQVGIIAADEVAIKLVTLEEAKSQHCSLGNSPGSCAMRHICMHCFQPFKCVDMVITSDSRWTCPPCSTKAPATKARPKRSRDVISNHRAVSQGVGNIKRKALKRNSYPVDYTALENKLLSFLYSTHDWQDINDGIRSSKNAVYDEEVLDANGWMLPHPAQPSVDNIFRFTFVDGHAVQHDAENVGLTALCINYMKNHWVPAIIPVMAAGAQQTLLENNGAKRDHHFWRDWNNALDRIHRLHLLLPGGRRLYHMTIDEVDEEQLLEYMQSSRSSSWKPEQRSPVSGYRPRYATTSGDCVTQEQRITGSGKTLSNFKASRKKWKEVAASKSPPAWPQWTDKEKGQLERLVDEIERDERINKSGLRIPRNKRVPWPFRVDHMLQDDDLWEWWFDEAFMRFWRFFWVCNLEHDTTESPMTIMLEIVVQWFKTGGIYDFMHCEMTVYEGHPTRFSIGRSAVVAPGSPMRTGWTTATPTSFREHYDIERSTVVIQPWCINSLWNQFPADTHPLIAQILRQMRPQAPHYNEFQRNTDPVPYPKLSKRARVSGEQAVIDIDDDEEKGDEDDDPQSSEEELASENENELPGNSDGAGSSEEEEEDTGDPDDVQVLQEELDELMTNLSESYPDHESDHKFAGYLRKLHRAMNRGDIATFWKVYDDVTDSLEALGEESGTCCECGETGDEASMLVCENPEHPHAIFHWKCDKSLTHRPGEMSALCPTCKAALRPQAECCIDACSMPVDQDLMVFCANPSHEGAIFHWTCDDDLLARPDEGISLCPTCKAVQAEAERGSVAHSKHRNMYNLGLTCYASSTAQILRHITPVINILSDDKNIVARTAKESGRFPREWLPKGYDLRETTSEPTVLQWSFGRMNGARGLWKAFSDLCAYLRDTKGSLDRSTSKHFLECMRTAHPGDWRKNVNWDSAEFLLDMLQSFILLTDDSTVGDGRVLESLRQREDADIKEGKELASITLASPSQFSAFCGKGRSCKLTGIIYHQAIIERPCPDPSCSVVGRNFVHECFHTLYLPNPSAPASEFTLTQMLQEWTFVRLDDPQQCPRYGAEHQGPVTWRQRITICPEVMVFRFSRGQGEGLTNNRIDHVDFAEYLDLSPYGDKLQMPSDEKHGTGPTSFNEDSIYQLIAINMYIPGARHFVAYVVVDGEWVLFDDLTPTQPARFQHPQLAFNDPNRVQVPYYLVYQQMKGKKSLPLDKNGIPAVGHMFVKGATVPPAKVANMYDIKPTEAAEVKCPRCNLRCENQIDLDDHLSTQHNDGDDTLDDSYFVGGGDPMQTDYHCKYCKINLASDEELREHVRGTHPELSLTGAHQLLAVQREAEKVQQEAAKARQDALEDRQKLDKARQDAQDEHERHLQQAAQQERELQASRDRRSGEHTELERKTQAAHDGRMADVAQQEEKLQAAHSRRVAEIAEQERQLQATHDRRTAERVEQDRELQAAHNRRVLELAEQQIAMLRNEEGALQREHEHDEERVTAIRNRQQTNEEQQRVVNESIRRLEEKISEIATR
jgi:hypothetical protein